ncbi:M20 family metallopeptidase [Nitriliruptor alkaliphilus]|uniref:M20 family metallopeptidase n=1 Tax=Nitriliruptor alkaliphilus TaxID=427918 RepID=UPI000A659367|nr:M20 family metallopeptidase [Nitriliruptor alkaliphilus]
MPDVRAQLAASTDARREVLVGLSHAVHGDAELRFEEHTSSQRVAAVLDAGGFTVDHGVAGLETAFTARIGTGDLHVGICAEYDALPSIGHACGHNIIAAAAAGAGLALAEVVDDLGLTVTVFGTPAEEGGGGKIIMLDAGLFEDVHAAMMVHPAPYESVSMPCLAVRHLDVAYTGRSAHASAYPQMGINAADALTVAQVGIGLLRQHIAATDRIHGIVTHGGDAPNIVPHQTAGRWYVRAADLEALAELEPRVAACFEAGALATGASLQLHSEHDPYSEMRADAELGGIYRIAAEDIGRSFPPEDEDTQLAGSTDMANVSLRVPTIHPMIAIDAGGAVNHQPEFTAACVNASADAAVRDGALAMATTAAWAASDTATRHRLQAEAAARPSTRWNREADA